MQESIPIQVSSTLIFNIFYFSKYRTILYHQKVNISMEEVAFFLTNKMLADPDEVSFFL
jgi:hypothetical protein